MLNLGIFNKIQRCEEVKKTDFEQRRYIQYYIQRLTTIFSIFIQNVIVTIDDEEFGTEPRVTHAQGKRYWKKKLWHMEQHGISSRNHILTIQK